MKRLAWLCTILVLLHSVPVHAQGSGFPEVFAIETTAYCQGEITASGTKVRYGICAVKEEWMGLTAIVYSNEDGKPMELLGIFECLDTGFGRDKDGDGVGTIEEGKCIDIYFPTLEECYEWMELTDGKCFIQLVDAKG